MAAPQGVTFDGTNDYLTRGGALTGVSDGNRATGSFWFKSGTIDFNDRVLYVRRTSNTNLAFGIHFQADGRITFQGFTSGGAQLLLAVTDVGYEDGAWHHCCFSFDLSSTALRHVYVDDAAPSVSWLAYTDGSINFAGADSGIGAREDGGTKYGGDLADIYVNFGVYVDLSTAANRRRFVGEGAASAVDLGVGGSGPTGAAPAIFLSGPTSAWHTNGGGGGGFTENGALADASTNPPNYGEPVVESFTATYASANATSITGTKPSGTVEGDLIVAIHGADGNPTLTPESGFTSITGDIAPGACVAEASYKVAGGSEPADYTFDCSASETQILYLLRISGVDTGSPINIYGTDSNGNAIDLDAPSVTTTVDGTRIIRAAIKNAVHNDTLGFDDGNVTELSLGATTAGTGNIQGAVAHEVQASAGATGTETYDGGNSADDIVTFTIAIAPASEGGDTAIHRPLMLMGVG